MIACSDMGLGFTEGTPNLCLSLASNSRFEVCVLRLVSFTVDYLMFEICFVHMFADLSSAIFTSCDRYHALG